MTHRFTDELLHARIDGSTTPLIAAARLTRCTFHQCVVGVPTDPAQRTVVRDVEVHDCRIFSGLVGPAIFEDIRIANLRTSDLLIVWGALFKRVTLAGLIGRLKINTSVGPMVDTPTQAAFDAFRQSYYGSADWALDISAAKFRGFEVCGIPARLFRRDPESQVVITRERAQVPRWRRGISHWNRLWPFMIEQFLLGGEADIVLVAPLGAPKQRREELLNGLRELRTIGVAEPD